MVTVSSGCLVSSLIYPHEVNSMLFCDNKNHDNDDDNDKKVPFPPY